VKYSTGGAGETGGLDQPNSPLIDKASLGDLLLPDGTASPELLKMNSFVCSRLMPRLYRHGGQRKKTTRVRWSSGQCHAIGLYRLRGTVRLPSQATSLRSSLSRMRESHTHGERSLSKKG
jgi:hypothetical protein